MKRIVPMVVFSLSSCIIAIALAGCGSKHENVPEHATRLEAVQVSVRRIESKPRMLTEEVVGTVQAKRHATLEPKLSGRIAAMPVVLGQSVKAGDLLVSLDTAEIRARLEQAEAALAQAEPDWKRTSALFGQQAATRAEYDAAESKFRMAKAVVDEAKAMMDYARVVAPFDGVVTKKWADVGDFAMPGKPLISVEDPSVLQVESDVPQDLASKVSATAPVAVQIDGMDQTLNGIVSEVAPAGDPVSRTFHVKVDLPRLEGLNTGAFARLLIPVGERSSLRVPASALVRRGQLEIVFEVLDGRARLRLVKTGKRIAGEWEILSGLDADATIVVEGAARLTDGQAVDLQ